MELPKARRRRWQPSFNVDYIGADENCQMLSELELDDLIMSLQDIQFSYKDKNMKKIGGEIDSAIVKPVHECLKEYATPFQLSHLGFWRWLSNVACDGFFWEFINWRFNESEQQGNWGITSQGSIIEVYFYRAWLRAHKMFEPDAADPYKYALKGSSDMWRSHILRQDFGRDREFTKAFLDIVYDESGKTEVGTKELRTVLIPAIRAWTSGGSFSHLSYQECLKLLIKLRAEGI